MQYYTLFTLALASLSVASPAPVSENPSSVLYKRNFGNCNGCGKCNLSNTFIGNCHDAVNKFQSGYNYNSRMLRQQNFAAVLSSDFTLKQTRDSQLASVMQIGTAMVRTQLRMGLTSKTCSTLESTRRRDAKHVESKCRHHC